MNVKVFFDFDGTISLQDVGDSLFSSFADVSDVVADLMSSKISVAEYYTRCCQRISGTMTPSDFEAFLSKQQIDYSFKDILHLCEDHNIELRILSDGLDAYIMPMLQADGITGVEVFSNTLTYNQGTWTAEFPGATESCDCFCASCKRNVVVNHSADDDVVVYVGDGMSDTCAVQHADVVFAKGYLGKWCTANGIPHHPVTNLSQVLAILKKRISQNDFKQRRRAVIARASAFASE